MSSPVTLRPDLTNPQTGAALDPYSTMAGWRTVGYGMDANGETGVSDPNLAAVIGWNDYVRARQDAIDAYLRGDYTGGVPPDISNALQSRSSSGTFYNRSTDRPNITPEMQPLVDTLVSQYEGFMRQGNQLGSYLPAGYEAQALQNLSDAGAIDAAKITAAAPPGYTPGAAGDPLAAALNAQRLDTSAGIRGPGGLEDQARNAVISGYGSNVYEPFLRTNTKVESGTESSNETQNSPRSAQELLAFLTPNSPTATYEGPTSNAWGTAAQMAPAAFNLFGSWANNRQPSTRTTGTASPSTGADAGYGAWGSW